MAVLNLSLPQEQTAGLEKHDDNYGIAHDATTAANVYPGNTQSIGQYYDPDGGGEFAWYYHLLRVAASFDTSSIDSSALIKSAYITSTVIAKNNVVTILLKNGMPDYPHVPPVAGDYNFANYSGNGGGVEISANATSFVLNLNSTGRSWINKDGYTKFLIVSQNDNISEPPTEDEYKVVYTVNTAILTVEYYVPSDIPVVGDPTYSPKATYAVATANVSDAGGGYEERGFEYGTSEVATWAVRETGVWGATGNFSLTLLNLLPLTTYYARAYVVNDYGTGFSDWTSFTTTDVPTYGIYEESNVATICFYVRKIGGKWSIKHGPYTTDQADIKITDILTEGTGKYQIKFESDVLTGLSASIMCKLDVKVRG